MTTPTAPDPPVSSYARLCQPATLQTAWNLVQRGGPAPGVDGRTLEQFAAVAAAELHAIAEDLCGRRYRFFPARRAFVPKPTGSPRRLGIPTVRDRVVQQAMRLVLEPLLSPAFSIGSFAYRAGRGVHSALGALLQHRRTGKAWILQSDIQDFFDSIDHGILLDGLARAKIDPELLHLVERFLAAGVRLGRRWFRSRRGVCQGSPLSPLLANFYLNPFDHAVQRAGFELVRYADDLLVCCTTRQEAKNALTEVRRQLARLKLALNPAKTRILNAWRDSFEFLGFLVTPKGLHPADSNVQRLRQTISDLTGPGCTVSASDLVAQINPLIRSFRGYYQGCRVDGLLAELDAWIAARLTACLKRRPGDVAPPDFLYHTLGLERLLAAPSPAASRAPFPLPSYNLRRFPPSAAPACTSTGPAVDSFGHTRSEKLGPCTFPQQS